MQFLLDFYTDNFETMHTCSNGLKMCMWFWDYPSIILFSHIFALFQLRFFFVVTRWQGCIHVGAGVLFSWSEDVHVLLG